jgi:hypothetical protein
LRAFISDRAPDASLCRSCCHKVTARDYGDYDTSDASSDSGGNLRGGVQPEHWLARVELGKQPAFQLGMAGGPKLRAWRLAKAARRAERKTAPPPPVPDPSKIAAEADDLEEIKKAVENAASVSGGLWLFYLFVLSYIAIAAGAVTHEDLLLIRPVKLPFLNVELPLKAFFALAPFYRPHHSRLCADAF